MTNRIAYEMIVMEAERLFDKIAVARNQEEVFARYKDYTDYLQLVGWTPDEFDREQLKRIDKDWETPQN